MPAKTAHDLMVVFGGRVGFVALSLIGTSLILRHLNAAEVGIYWLCLAASKIVTSCLADGLDLAVLRSVPTDLQRNRPRALDTLRAAFFLRMMIVCLIAAIVTIFSPALASSLFRRSDYGHLLVLTGFSIIGEMLLRSVMAYFQASNYFSRLVFLEGAMQVARFAGIAGLLAAGRLSASTALWAYLLPPFVSFAAGLFLLPTDLRWPRMPKGAEMSHVFAYSKWIVVVMALAAVYERLDVMLLGYFRGPADVGIYAPAVMLATLPELVVSVVLTVLTPQVGRYYESGHFTHLLRRYLRYAVPIGALAVAGALTIAGPVIQTIFGAKYADSVPLFKVLALGTLFFAVVTPPCAALLSLFAPKRSLTITLCGLFLVLTGGVLVVPAYGALGAAVLLTTVRLTTACLIVVLALPVARLKPLATSLARVPTA
jgi:O-antigen/teichoic acid export membrane protein